METKKQVEKKPLINLSESDKRFLLKFFTAFTAFYLLALILPLNPVLEWIAGVEQGWLLSLGLPAELNGNLIKIGFIEFEIVNECSSLVMIALLAALLYASEAKADWRALAAGAPLLFSFNLVRLLFTLYAGAAYGNSILEIVHYVLWIVDAAIVLAVWYAIGLKHELPPESLHEQKGKKLFEEKKEQ